MKSSLTFPYTFKNNTDYVLILQARISGGSKYESTPLTASFNISAVDPISSISFDHVIYFVIPITILAGIIVTTIVISRKKYNIRH